MASRNKLALGVLVALSTLAAGVQAQESGMETDPANEEQSATTLDSVVVQGAFIESGTRSAMKMDVGVNDTPYSVSTYSENFIESIEATNVADLYKYMTGVQKAGSSAQDISIRGFKMGGSDRNALMVDGLPGLTGRFSSPPTIAVEGIDVIRGPASVLYGQAQPGGFVNLVTKKPKATQATEIFLKGTTYSSGVSGFGDDTGYDMGVDSTGAVDDEGRFLYRLIAQHHDNDTFRDYTYNTGTFIAPSATWNISDATSATLALEFREYENAYDKYLTAPGKDITRIAPITTRYQQPGDYQKETGSSATLSLRHNFENGTVWNFALRSANSTDQARAFDAVAVRPNQEYISRRAVRNKNKRTSLFFDTSLEVPFSTGRVEHQAIMGINGGEDTTDLNRLQFFNGPATGPQSLDVSIYNPNYDGFPTHEELPLVNPATPRNLTHRYTESRAFGIYAADLITLSEHWKVNLGLRRTYDRQHIEELRIAGVPSTTKSASKVLPQAGVLFQPSEDLTFYSSFSTSYVPAASNVQDVNGRNPFDPEQSTQVEVGAKINSFNGRVQATLALFRIEKEDSITSFTCPIGTCSEQIGAERSKGAEFEVNARPTDSWQIAFGYARADAIVSESRDLAKLNARSPNSARDTAQIWTRYDVPEGVLKGLGLGFGYSYTGERAGNLPSTADTRVIRLPSYSVADMAFYYSHRRTQYTLKVGNLFDKRYFESTGLLAETQVQPGLPRNLTFSVRYAF